ncbi:serine protease SPPA, chloroplastic [Olea europaea subsp. europaea]|uniref:Serine protease SPPA, chloroplastic n=1 Tax=Olea europaea subsp. europaea TaxID=158383 RepID=A0A8S0STT7_OLEEU|nr:serine protease SPPA, chloroplastic [Olea europaea subsp. europaea]
MPMLLTARRSAPIRLHTWCSIISRLSFSIQQPFSFLSPYPKPQFLFKNIFNFRRISTRAFDIERNEVASDQDEKVEVGSQLGDSNDNGSIGGCNDDTYPSGEFVFREYDLWDSFAVKLKMVFALPWERVKKGSVLTMKIRGQISDQLKGRFSSGLSLPQICENFIKAAYDPRIVGIYLHIEPLSCGWGKVEEIRRHILDFKKSGTFIVGYVPACGEKEYYIGSACEELYAPPSAYFHLYGLTVSASFLRGVLDKVGIEPQIQRIGKYKSAGDRLARTDISDENRETLTALLDNIYGNWLDKVSLAKGKKKEDIENFVNEGVYEVERLKEGCWITDIKYDDEVISLLKERLGFPNTKTLPTVDYRKYSRVRKWTLGLTGYKDKIAIIRVSGAISRTRGSLSVSSSGIIAEKFIEKIRSVRESKVYKAVVIRIDSPGGDALASDLMWREIKLLAASKPVIASMADVAASGGYYMAMAAHAIVAENLTLTGSIGVVTGKLNLEKLYEKIGFNKEIISRGRYSELTAAEQRPFRADEAELFAKSAQYVYKNFRDKAAFSRSMTVESMEEVAQGRVWTGSDAATRGLVDAIGGLSRAVAIAKQKANIPVDKQVTLVELSRHSSSLFGLLSGLGNSIVEADTAVKELLEVMASSSGIQARMDGIVFEKLEGASYAGVVFKLIKDYLRSF